MSHNSPQCKTARSPRTDLERLPFDLPAQSPTLRDAQRRRGHTAAQLAAGLPALAPVALTRLVRTRAGFSRARPVPGVAGVSGAASSRFRRTQDRH